MAIVPNGCSPSTTFVWKKVKIMAPPRPQGIARAKRAPQAVDSAAGSKRPRRPRDLAGVMVRYRGGPECFWELTYSGVTVRVPGWIQLHDAMRLVLDAEL